MLLSRMVMFEAPTNQYQVIHSFAKNLDVLIEPDERVSRDEVLEVKSSLKKKMLILKFSEMCLELVAFQENKELEIQQ